MRLLTYLELSRYSIAQLHCVVRRMWTILPHLAPGTAAHEAALMNLRHARLFLDRHQRRVTYRL